MNQDNENLLNSFASSVVDVLVPNNILSVTMPKQTDERDFPDFFSSVKNAQEKVFLDNKVIYVRTSPSTEKLEGRDLSSYVLNRFK